MSAGSSIKQGMLLVSEPYSYDMYFRRAVVLVAEHNENVSVGFILNKSLEYNLSDLVETIPERNYRISLGGPVGHNTLNFIHTLGNVAVPQAFNVAKNLYWGGNFGMLTGLINLGAVAKDEILFFLGYSGWSPGQLEDEMARGDWAAVSSAPYDIIHAGDTLWYDIVHSEPTLASWRYIPENPGDN